MVKQLQIEEDEEIQCEYLKRYSLQRKAKCNKWRTLFRIRSWRRYGGYFKLNLLHISVFVRFNSPILLSLFSNFTLCSFEPPRSFALSTNDSLRFAITESDRIIITCIEFYIFALFLSFFFLFPLKNIKHLVKHHQVFININSPILHPSYRYDKFFNPISNIPLSLSKILLQNDSNLDFKDPINT